MLHEKLRAIAFDIYNDGKTNLRDADEALASGTPQERRAVAAVCEEAAAKVNMMVDVAIRPQKLYRALQRCDADDLAHALTRLQSRLRRIARWLRIQAKVPPPGWDPGTPEDCADDLHIHANESEQDSLSRIRSGPWDETMEDETVAQAAEVRPWVIDGDLLRSLEDAVDAVDEALQEIDEREAAAGSRPKEYLDLVVGDAGQWVERKYRANFREKDLPWLLFKALLAARDEFTSWDDLYREAWGGEDVDRGRFDTRLKRLREILVESEIGVEVARHKKKGGGFRLQSDRARKA